MKEFRDLNFKRSAGFKFHLRRGIEICSGCRYMSDRRSATDKFCSKAMGCGDSRRKFEILSEAAVYGATGGLQRKF